MYCITDPIEAHRELQRQLQSGAITPAEYRAAFRTTDATLSRLLQMTRGEVVLVEGDDQRRRRPQ